MKLTRASSYALIAVAHMAQQNDDKPVASHHIAEARGIPERFLLKVLKPLVGANVLRSIKGPNGGYRLARAASDISMLEIIEAVDGPIRGLIPPPFSDPKKKTNPGAEKANAPLNNKLEKICDQTADAVKDQLKRVRVADLAAGKARRAKDSD